MATGGTARPVALTNPAQSLLDQSDSNMSSPLTDVEDKDGDPEDMDLDFNDDHDTKDTDAEHENAEEAHAPSAVDDDDDSNLSDVDINDSEAETERLYDSPGKPTAHRDTVVIPQSPVGNKAAGSRDRVFEHSPSKLQYQVQTAGDTKGGDAEDEAMSETGEGDDHESEDALSVASSGADARRETTPDTKRPAKQQERTSSVAKAEINGAAAEGPRQGSPGETRKRKRSSQPEKPEADEPTRKRTGSVGVVQPGTPVTDAAGADDELEAPSTKTNSGERSAEDDGHGAEADDKVQDATDSIEESSEGRRSSKSRRSSTKKRKEAERERIEADEEVAESAGEPQAEDEHAEPEVGGEAEAAHRNEEELEKKRAAFEQLTNIEKHFHAFRDRLYEERLAQLEQEEAMLKGDSPTHPEYLAMMQCIDARRDDRLRSIDLEFKYNVDAVQRWAVARRTQILTQFYQGVRESRLKVLEELGQQWYEIQAERRKYANSVPDYGIRFPTSKTEQKRQAVAYSKEVSILAGIARHEGFPAAPEMKGASSGEIEDDLDAINRARQVSQQSVGVQPPFQDYGGLTFGRGLGPAGEQFLEQTPWANPNHPSHQIQRQAQHEPVSGPSGRRRTPLPGSAPHLHGSSSSSVAGGAINGTSQPHKAHVNGPEKERTRLSKMPPELRPETVAQSS